MTPHLRIARPVSDPARSAQMYCNGLDLAILGSFKDHDGFDGVMVGAPAECHHFEFTYRAAHPVAPTPTAEDLVVLYLPREDEWTTACIRMLAAGFTQVASLNPYWETRGRTFADSDGYRTVLQCAEWKGGEAC